MSLRDLTKSALSFSWALSLLGAKQAVNLIQPRQRNGSNLFAPIAQVAADQLDESMRGIYRSGDALQASAVDMAFTWMNPANWFNPNTWLRPLAGRGRTNIAVDQEDCGCSQNGGNASTRTASGLGQMFGQAAADAMSAVEQAASSVTQAATGFAAPGPRTAAPPVTPSRNAPISNDSAASGWGPMPVDS